MPEYFLKNAGDTVTKMYRLNYGPTGQGGFAVNKAFIAGTAVPLPDGTTTTGQDTEVDVKHVLVDLVLASMVPGTLDEYRALMKTRVDALWG